MSLTIVPLIVGDGPLTERFDQQERGALRLEAERALEFVRAKLPPATTISPQALLDDVAFIAESRSHGAESWRGSLFTHISQASVECVLGPGSVYRESHFFARAKELQEAILRELAKKGIVPNSRGEVELHSNHGKVKVRIAGFKGITDPHYPSCALFDLAWSEWRLSKYSHVFTVLPESYRGQQLATAALAALTDLPGREKLITLFLGADQLTIVDEFVFSDINLASVDDRHPT